MKYTQLTTADMHYIEKRRRLGDSTTKIAKDLERSQSKTCRKLNRNKGLRGYRHIQT